MSKKAKIIEHFTGRWQEFYGRFVKLPTGHNGYVKISSPLREGDDDPSFQISFEGQYESKWKDHGTGEFGDPFAFYMRFRGVQTFSEAIEGIVEEFDISIASGGKTASNTPKKRVKTLAGRGISQDTAKAFQIEETQENGQVAHQIRFPIFDKENHLNGHKIHKGIQTKGIKAQLYPWKALNNAEVYIVNGEPSVWRAWESGYRNVLCGTGGEGTFKNEWLDDFKAKIVRLVLDNDESGKKGMILRAKKLCGVAKSVEIVEWPDSFKNKGDAEDWLNQGNSLKDLVFKTFDHSQVVAIDRADIYTWSEPQPLPNTTPPVEPFVLDLLPVAFHGWISDTSSRMQCPMDYPAVGAMIALSSVVGRQLGIRPKVEDDWTVVPNLWGGVVGRPGLLKTPALAEVLRPIDSLEARAREDHEVDQRSFDADKLVREARIKQAKGEIAKALKAGNDPSVAAESALLSDETLPVRQRYRTNDPSMEKLGELLNQNPRGLLLFRDELTGFLRTLDRDGHESDRAFYLEAWNGTGGFTFDRIGRGTIDIKGACISILGGIQPGPMRAYMSRAARGGQDDDGLVQRFQLCVWPDQPEQWVNVDRAPDMQARKQAYEVFNRLDGIDPVSVGAQTPQDDCELPFLRFTPDAQELFTEWRTALEYRLRGDDMVPMMEAYLAKYRSLIPSLALLIHLADVGKGPVTADALERACAWGEYLESHTKRIYAPALSPDIEASGDLAEHIRRGDLGSEFALRQVQQKGWSGLTERDTIKAGLDMLVDMDWLHEKTEQSSGRPRTRYIVNPRVMGSQHG
jgi:hypothetical protein